MKQCYNPLVKKLGLLLLSLSLASWAQSGKPNFSGTWDLQVDKSDFGPMPGPQAQTTVIEHKDPKLKVTSKSKSDRGERTVERTLTTDGQENTNEVAGAQWKSKTRWVENELVTESQFEAQGAKIQMKDHWKLSDDAKTFTVERALSSEMGEAAQKLIYTKKSD